MTRRHRRISRKRTLSQRLGVGNVLSDGMLRPVDPTDIAVFEITRNVPKGTKE